MISFSFWDLYNENEILPLNLILNEISHDQDLLTFSVSNIDNFIFFVILFISNDVIPMIFSEFR